MSCALANESVTVAFRSARSPPVAVTSTACAPVTSASVSVAVVPVTSKSVASAFSSASLNVTRHTRVSAFVGEASGVCRVIDSTAGAVLSRTYSVSCAPVGAVSASALPSLSVMSCAICGERERDRGLEVRQIAPGGGHIDGMCPCHVGDRERGRRSTHLEVRRVRVRHRLAECHPPDKAVGIRRRIRRRVPRDRGDPRRGVGRVRRLCVIEVAHRIFEPVDQGIGGDRIRRLVAHFDVLVRLRERLGQGQCHLRPLHRRRPAQHDILLRAVRGCLLHGESGVRQACGGPERFAEHKHERVMRHACRFERRGRGVLAQAHRALRVGGPVLTGGRPSVLVIDIGSGCLAEGKGLVAHV